MSQHNRLGPSYRKRPRCRHASYRRSQQRPSSPSSAASTRAPARLTSHCRQCQWRHYRKTRSSASKRWQVSHTKAIALVGIGIAAEAVALFRESMLLGRSICLMLLSNSEELVILLRRSLSNQCFCVGHFFCFL